MLQNSRSHPVQGLVLDLPTSRALHEGKEAWMGRREKRIYRNEKLSRNGAKSQRDFDPKPGVARDEQPRVPVRLRFNLEEVVAEGGLDLQPGAWCNGRNSVGVKLRGGFPPQVARSSQPGAGGRDPFGIRSGSMRSAHDPTKDSCCRTATHTGSRN